MFSAFFVRKGVLIKLLNGKHVIAKSYKEEYAEETIRLIQRNFREVNVKDYGEEAMTALCATHDLNWFRGLAAILLILLNPMNYF